MSLYENDLKSFVQLSTAAGKRVDYVQAGGGNTSVKFADGTMAIKASGYTLREMTETHAFVAVDGAKMRAYHLAEHPAETDCNKEATDIAMTTICSINGEPSARPSVEVGFHSVLDKFVLHLHPVYVNVLMCSAGGVEKALQIAKDAGLSAAAVPYAMPGYSLTKLILSAVEAAPAAVQVIFLKNHGVITMGSTAEEALSLMDKVNDAIIAALQLPAFPTPAIMPCANGFKSTCPWLRDVLEVPGLADAVRYKPIYPDQLVYTADAFSTDAAAPKKITVEGGTLVYRAGEKEALALEETMVALFYIYDTIRALGLQYEELSDADCARILNWDSEKYRKSLMAAQD